MSKVRMAVASRTAFEALNIEGEDDTGYSSDVEDASTVPVQDKPSTLQAITPNTARPPPHQAVSKKAAKRAAKAAASSPTSPESDSSSLTPTAPPTVDANPLPAAAPVAAATVPDEPKTNGLVHHEGQEMRLPEVDQLLAPPPPEDDRPAIYDVPEPTPQPPAPPPKLAEEAKHKPAPLAMEKPKVNGVVPSQSPETATTSYPPIPLSPTPRKPRSDSNGAVNGNGNGTAHKRGQSASPAPPSRAQALGHAAHTPSALRMSQRMREVVPPPGSERAKKFRSIIVRTMTTLIMLALFFLIMAGGTPFVVMLVLVCQALVYREVTALFELTAQSGGRPIEGKGAEKSEDRWSKTLNWYFFAVTNYFLYGESLIHYFKHVVFADAWLTPFATNHRFISFMLYMIGFVGFVSNLKRQYLRQQFGLFCWVHMTLFLIVVSSHFIVNNILEGLIWFWVPACLVICNDIFAYVWGMSFGRTPLIQLSPKKTVEGFVGAFFTTLVFAYILGTFSMRFNYMICPGHDLGVTAWDNVECEKNPVFIWRDLPIGEPLVTILSTWVGWVMPYEIGADGFAQARRPVTSIPVAPFQFHSVVLACFASLVAPFGGFFASGFKRAFDIKDFGDSIPGHGGMTDRMDCQFLMGMFTYVYYSTLIRVNHVTPGSILQIIVSSLGPQEQLELYRELTSYLHGRGLLGSS